MSTIVSESSAYIKSKNDSQFAMDALSATTPGSALDDRPNTDAEPPINVESSVESKFYQTPGLCTR